MSKKAANTDTMGELHDKVAKVFTRVLTNYEKQYDEADGEAIEIEPSPAMLSAAAKFLKDNDISYDDGAVEELSAVEASLKARKAARKNVTVLADLRAVDNG